MTTIPLGATPPPRPTVAAYAGRPAVATVRLHTDLAVTSTDPERLFALADAFLRAGLDLEEQIQLDQVPAERTG